MQNVQIEFWQDVSSLLFEMRISTVATALKKILDNDHFHPFFDIIVFLLSRINYPNRDFFHWQFFFTCVPPEKPSDIVFTLPVLKRLQSWRISRIKDNSKGN